MTTLVHPKLKELLKELPDSVLQAVSPFATYCSQYLGQRDQRVQLYAEWVGSGDLINQLYQQKGSRDVGTTFALEYTYRSWSVYHNDVEWEESVTIRWNLLGEDYNKKIEITRGIS